MRLDFYLVALLFVQKHSFRQDCLPFSHHLQTVLPNTMLWISCLFLALFSSASQGFQYICNNFSTFSEGNSIKCYYYITLFIYYYYYTCVLQLIFGQSRIDSSGQVTSRQINWIICRKQMIYVGQYRQVGGQVLTSIRKSFRYSNSAVVHKLTHKTFIESEILLHLFICLYLIQARSRMNVMSLKMAVNLFKI